MLKAEVAKGNFQEHYPVLSDAEIRRLAGRPLTAEELAKFRTVAKSIQLEKEKQIVYPAWAQAILRNAIPNATKFLDEGNYANAREGVWRASTTGVKDVDEAVRKEGYEFLNTKVNPKNWGVIEQELVSKTKEFTDSKQWKEGIKWLEEYPLVRTFSTKIDSKLESVKAELVELGVNVENVAPAVATNLQHVAFTANILDERDKTTNVVSTVTTSGTTVNTSAFDAKLKEYRDLLVLHNTTTNGAQELANEFKKSVADYINALNKKGTSTSTTTDFLYLGTSAINLRINKFRNAKIAAEEKEAADANMKSIVDDLVKRVSELVAAEKFTEAREVIRDVALVNDKERDAKIYAVRIGLLNSLVNPNQNAKLGAGIDAKVKEFMDAQDYEGLRDYAKGYEFVHDTYQQILASLEQIKTAMTGLSIADQPAEKYIAELTARIAEILEKRQGTYDVKQEELNLKELEKALAELQKSYIAQHYDEDAAAKLCEALKKEIVAMVGKAPLPALTTWEMNEALRAKLALATKDLDALIAKRDAAKALENLDKEISFDSQIALAEDAIAKQLGVVCPEAFLEMNAVLGDYARAIRNIKRIPDALKLESGDGIPEGAANTLLIGSVYLDQPAVFDFALRLKANIDEPALRDPRKRPALLVAIENGRNSFLKKIADANGSQTFVDASGNTALHYAMRRGNLNVAKLVAKNVDVKAVNDKGETALFTAVRRNQAAPVRALLSLLADDAAKKAYVLIENAEGDDAFTAACKANAHTVLDALADAGANYGTDNLVDAAANDRIAIAQWLVERGLDVNADGVMAATVDKSATLRYLVAEGGIAPVREKVKEEPAVAPETAQLSGTITFDVKK